MTDGVPRSQLVLYAAAALVVAVLGARYLGGSGSPGSATPPAGTTASGGVARIESARPAAVLVHVAGAVREPGVYRLRAGARIDDAVRRAGGPTQKADLGAVNLAAKVEDGRQVLVPERAAVQRGAAGGGAAGGAGGGVGAAGATGGTGTAGGAGAGPPLNLNTATLEQLDTLAGIGPATAQKILDAREAQGGFGSVDDLADVPGIGEKRLASLKEQVTP